MDITVIHLPDDLRAALREAKLNQTQLGYATGIDAGTISRYVNGLKPTPRNAARIAEALGLVVDGPVAK
jgi:transcriptional regulator with XRE-family HTH domain